MKNGSILTMVAFIFFLSGCGPSALVEFAPLAPSPTPIAVSTLAPATPTLFLEVEGTAAAPVEILQPTATAIPTETALPVPTSTPEPDWLAYSGRTEDGLMFLGNPEAPVKMIDFSDFM